MNSHRYDGLDAQNPLGFLAALGLLRVLDYQARENDAPRPRLAFSKKSRRVACVTTHLTRDEVVATVLEDSAQQAISPLSQLAYDAAGAPTPPTSDGAVRDLKLMPPHAKMFLRDVANGPRRDADLAAGLFSDAVQANDGRTKPTALYFTAGQQQFLKMVEDLRVGVTEADVREALDGPWEGASKLPSLSWDSTQARLYALRASDPSSEKRGSVAAANWLAFQALALFPVAPRGSRLFTTGVRGGWKDSNLTWPLWDSPLSLPVAAALLRVDVSCWNASERVAYGVSDVIAAGIGRSDQGGYGTFSPAEVILPPVANRHIPTDAH